MTTRQAWVQGAATELKAAGVSDPVRDARLLLRWILDLTAVELSMALTAQGTEDEKRRYRSAVARRAAREPLSHITGHREFWGRRFRVNSDVLDPRPETETLVAEALHRGPFQNVLDLGTGSGCLLVTLLAEWSGAKGLGVDISDAALAVASCNAQDLGVDARARLAKRDWLEGVEGQFDLIVSNPPYIARAELPTLSPEVQQFEPHQALFAEEEGLAAYRQIATQAPRVLSPGGVIMLEIGAGQSDAVSAILAERGWLLNRIIPDLDQRARVLVASR